MIDLTNYEHRRGIMILTSKDVRSTTKAAFDWKVHTNCIRDDAEVILLYLQKDELTDEDIRFIKQHAQNIISWTNNVDANINKVREVFR